MKTAKHEGILYNAAMVVPSLG